MHGDARQLRAKELRLSHVETGSDIDPQFPDRVGHPAGTADGIGRAREGREEPVARGIQLPPFEPFQLAAHDRVVPGQ